MQFIFSFVAFLSLIASGIEAASLERLSVNTLLLNSGRVIGGAAADENEFPWMVSLQRNGFFGRSHFCAGSIIDSNTIVTAAHCIEGLNPVGIWVVAAEFRLDVVSGSEQELVAAKVITHADYNSSMVQNDIGLLRLDGNLKLNGVNPRAVKLPKQGLSTGTGIGAIVAGWGATQEGGILSNYMMKATVPILSDKDCRTVYGQATITDSMICAGFTQGGTDACQGDSGGQLMLQDGTLVGIVSWGYGCGRPDYPGVYTEVSHFVNWISDNSRTISSVENNSFKIFH